MAVETDPTPTGSASAQRPSLRQRWRRRFHWDSYHWWHEVVLIAVGYAIYTVIRDTVPAHRATAFHNARDIVRWERDLGIFRELDVNEWLVKTHWLVDFADYWYATAHFAVTLGVAAWIIWKHPRLSRSLRIAWYSMNLYALIGFAFYPLAPPRFFDGKNALPNLHFVDTIMSYGIWGSVGKKGSADGASNQFAAMPSMHIGWSTWCAVVIVVVATRWWVKLLGALYPLVTLFSIIGTANHFFLDAVGGLGALALGFLTAWAMTRHGPFTPEPEPQSTS
ncbi:MAG TPA: phosphatase PAP2 family protein [Mycobacteriales bacterium]